jgi:hypothetical protein
LQQSGVAELPARRKCGLFFRHPLRGKPARQQAQVFLHFFVEFIVSLQPSEEPS